MVLIIDSGSTKSDWKIIEKEKVINSVTTQGFNPFFNSSAYITEKISNNKVLKNLASDASEVYFYGAGCSSDKLRATVYKGLKSVFTNAKINVDHDLTACAYATYTGEPGISCILGTGSNSCYYDGKEVSQAVPSLAYILGDEGSGGYFGKQLIKGLLYKQLPDDLRKDFKANYPDTNKDVILENVYQKPNANVYLASFAPFVIDRKNHSYFQKILIEGFALFFKNHICAYANYKDLPVHFIGSIAHLCEDELKTAADKFDITIGNIIRKPIDGLVNYHLQYS